MKCIIIDDEIMARAIISELITSRTEHVVEGEFDSAIEAIKYLNKKKVDLIFLDIHMPDFNGFDFIDSLKHNVKIIEIIEGQTSRISAVNKKIWIESSEGRKWATDLGKFEVYLELLIDLESTEAIQIKLDTLSSNIFFYGGQTKIKEYSEKDIMNIVNILKTYPTIRVEILGWHNTPKLDPGSENIDLKRANAVKVMLASKGIDESRMTAEGKGESTVVPDDTEKNQFGDDWNKNMRVDIKIVK